ncbi:MAG: hypothetical protein CMJ81_21985 [Planctomycetaceae bacterium]|nr:hypothetical protein [Planctomycetaceae bacterium]
MKIPGTTTLCIALLALSTTIGQAAAVSSLENRFYQSIGRGDVDTFYRMLHPALRAEVDRPVVKAWLEVVQARLGRCQSIEPVASSRTQQLTGVRWEGSSKITFAKGVADGSLSSFNGQVLSFQVQSEKMVDWFQGPKKIEVYTARAAAFMTAFLDTELTPAWELIHPALQDVVGKEGLKRMMARVVDNGGPLQHLQLKSHRFSLEGGNPTLFLLYDVECERANGTCQLEFQFVDMKGHLLGFDFQ